MSGRLPVGPAAHRRTLKLLDVIDEATRKALAIAVEHSIDADRGVAVLDEIAKLRGYPVYLDFDNAPEFLAKAVLD